MNHPFQRIPITYFAYQGNMLTLHITNMNLGIPSARAAISYYLIYGDYHWNSCY